MLPCNLFAILTLLQQRLNSLTFKKFSCDSNTLLSTSLGNNKVAIL